MTRLRTRAAAVALLLPLCLVLAAGCQAKRRPHWSDRDPDLRLDWLLTLYQERLQSGTSCQDLEDSVTNDCHRIVREVERLTLEFPNHDRILMANSLLAYDNGDKERAQQHLDILSARRRVHPEAAVLRARIALEDGNVRLARSLLERQMALAPDHAGLREALASALYFDGDYAGSRAALDMAAHLGAPLWRVSFHRGVLDEAEGRFAEARLHYRETLNQNPGFQPAGARLLALQVADDLQEAAP